MSNYSLQSVIGAGAQGTVYRAIHIPTNRLVAVKEITLMDMTSEERDGALQEVKVFASLSHPHILQYEDSFIHDGKLFIVMELASGGCLADVVKSKERLLTTAMIWKYFLEVVSALDHMHRVRILHRDLKTANVFLCGDTAKLGDFGVSRILSHTGQKVKSLIGTPFYLSPEMCHGRAYGPKSDVWALGCLLYELLMRKTAFHADNQAALVFNIIRGKCRSLDGDCDPQLAHMCKWCLQLQEKDRPTTTQILAHPYSQPHLLGLSLRIPAQVSASGVNTSQVPLTRKDLKANQQQPQNVVGMPALPARSSSRGRVPNARTRKVGKNCMPQHHHAQSSRPTTVSKQHQTKPVPGNALLPRRVSGGNRIFPGDVRAVRSLPDVGLDYSSDENVSSLDVSPNTPVTETTRRPHSTNQTPVPAQPFVKETNIPIINPQPKVMPGIGVEKKQTQQQQQQQSISGYPTMSQPQSIPDSPPQPRDSQPTPFFNSNHNCSDASVPYTQNDEEEEEDGSTVYVTWQVDGNSGTSKLQSFQSDEGLNEPTIHQQQSSPGDEYEDESFEAADYYDPEASAHLPKEKTNTASQEDCEEDTEFNVHEYIRTLREEASAITSPETFDHICFVLRSDEGPRLGGNGLQEYILKLVPEERTASQVLQLAFRVVFALGGA